MRCRHGRCPCINGDGVVNTADLGMLISVFGQVCDGCGTSEESSSQSLIAGPGTAQPSPLLNELGFTSSKSYCEWLDTLTPDQLEVHLSDCLAIIQAAE